MGLIALAVILLFVGLIFVIMAFTEPTWETPSRIFAVACGLLCLAFPFLMISTKISDIIKKKKEKKSDGTYKKEKHVSIFIKLKDMFSVLIGSIIPDGEGSETQTARFVRQFRESYRQFFEMTGLQENTPLQYDSTQIYWHIASLRKKRLDKKNIKLQFDSQRKLFDGLVPVTEKRYFDGKFQVSEISESVNVSQTFVRNKKTIMHKSLDRVAHYVITSAKKTSKNLIICPNCGQVTTRENLIDGCDYCNTKFSVEDLENKIAAFRVKDDYEIEYERYKVGRSRYNKLVFWLQFAVYLIITCIIYLCMFPDVVEYSGNVVLALLFIPLTSAVVAAMFAFLGLFFFWIFIFPILQVKASVSFLSKRNLDKMKKRYEKDTVAEANIREYDPLFSVSAFYSELMNKLACIHFADTKAEANAFFENDSSDFTSEYKDIVDMTIDDIDVTDFSISGNMQELKVNVVSKNLVDNGTRLKRQNERIKMTLVKSADCKTQAVCEPAVFKCKGCGRSLALEQGNTCLYCGRKIDLTQYDWVIRDYSIL